MNKASGICGTVIDVTVTGISEGKKKSKQRGLKFFFCYSLSCVQLFVTPGNVACQAPLAMGFSRQEYWSGLPYSPPGDLPDPEIEPGSPALKADSTPSELEGSPQTVDTLKEIHAKTQHN